MPRLSPRSKPILVPGKRTVTIRVAMPWALRESAWVHLLQPQITAAGNDARSRVTASGHASARDRVFEVRLMKAGAPGDIRAAIHSTMLRADILIFDLATRPGSIDGNPNVLLELGMALGLQRDADIYVIRSVGRRRPNLPSDIAGLIVHGPKDLGVKGSLYGLLREAVARKWRERTGPGPTSSSIVKD